MLVDHTANMERLEGFSFSMLHKWNFITPLIGRENRDIIMSAILMLAMMAALTGYVMIYRNRKRRIAVKLDRTTAALNAYESNR